MSEENDWKWVYVNDQWVYGDEKTGIFWNEDGEPVEEEFDVDD